LPVFPSTHAAILSHLSSSLALRAFLVSSPLSLFSVSPLYLLYAHARSYEDDVAVWACALIGDAARCLERHVGGTLCADGSHAARAIDAHAATRARRACALWLGEAPPPPPPPPPSHASDHRDDDNDASAATAAPALERAPEATEEEKEAGADTRRMAQRGGKWLSAVAEEEAARREVALAAEEIFELASPHAAEEACYRAGLRGALFVAEVESRVT
jgi:hypothetical protein